MLELKLSSEMDMKKYLVVAWQVSNFSKRLAVNKQLVQKFELERFNLRKLSDLEVSD